MIFSKPWTYAIRALLYLAEHRNEGPILSTTIAQEEGIPAPYLVKILGILNSAKIVSSTRGPGGGFSLQMDPKRLPLMKVVLLFDSIDLSGMVFFDYGRNRPCRAPEAFLSAFGLPPVPDAG